jgi:7-keto-8-aminopelargonate synthetase-like enzyme
VALNRKFDDELKTGIEQLKKDRVYKRLNYLDSPQSARVKMEGRGDVLILSSNNYLGLCDEPEVVRGGVEALDRFGAGTEAFASSAERSRSIGSSRRRSRRSSAPRRLSHTCRAGTRMKD